MVNLFVSLVSFGITQETEAHLKECVSRVFLRGTAEGDNHPECG